MQHKHLKNVATLSLTAEKCIGCGICTNVCPHRVFELKDKKAQIINDNCIECGACALNCPTNAIKVTAGTGCAAAFIIGWLTGSEPSCGGSDTNTSCC